MRFIVKSRPCAVLFEEPLCFLMLDYDFHPAPRLALSLLEQVASYFVRQTIHNRLRHSFLVRYDASADFRHLLQSGPFGCCSESTIADNFEMLHRLRIQQILDALILRQHCGHPIGALPHHTHAGLEHRGFCAKDCRSYFTASAWRRVSSR